jgi:hypothetical protein
MSNESVPVPVTIKPVIVQNEYTLREAASELPLINYGQIKELEKHINDKMTRI